MNEGMSPYAIYLIRRVLLKYDGKLKPLFPPGAALVADPFCDLYEVLKSLYMNEDEYQAALDKLEKLANLWKACDDSSLRQSVEDQILWIFCLKSIA